MKKGIGYIIESFLALTTITIFVFGGTATNTSAETNWNEFSQEISTADLSYIAQDEIMEDRIKRGELGTVQTILQSISSPSIEVSGSINLPLQGYRVGFRSPESRTPEVEDLDESSDTCSEQELSELESEYSIKAVDEPGVSDSRVVLYILDADPGTIGGGNGQKDYDTLYVDNKTECQFSPSEGPFRQGQTFKWGDSSDPSDFDYWDAENLSKISSSSPSQVKFLKASQMVRIRDTQKKTPNGINSRAQFDAFRLSSDDVSGFDTVVFTQGGSPSSLEALENNIDKVQRYKNSDGSIVLLEDLNKQEVEQNGFLQETPLSWVELGKTSGSSRFSESPKSVRLKTFYEGTGSTPDQLSLGSGGKVSSVQRTTSDTQLLYSDGGYTPENWNVTDFSMSTTNPGSVDGEPESECYSEPGSLTKGELEFVRESQTKTLDIINAELGGSESFCDNNNFRSIMIDFNENGKYEKSSEGPYVSGDSLSYKGRDYTVYLSDPDGEESQLVFSGSLRPEKVNYAPGYGNGMIRAPYEDKYSEAERRLVNSLILILLPQESEFGSEGRVGNSVKISSGIEGEVLLPYTANLQWDGQ